MKKFIQEKLHKALTEGYKSISNYLRNIRIDKNYKGGGEQGKQFNANFGRDGGVTWRIYEDENGNIDDSIYLSSIDRGGKYGFSGSKEGKKDSRGEGAMAIASLFSLYPNVKSLHYENESQNEDGTSFWLIIGGGNSELYRDNFFRYYNKKFT